MNLIEAVQSELIIKTGDGKEYKPFWKNSCAKEIEYNIAQFDFPKIQGSKIDRGTAQARKFTLEIYFQGENNLTEANNFEISANDPRSWKISHPIYGSITVQPVGLKINYESYNAIPITGTLLETLGSAGLKTTIQPLDKINADKEVCNENQVVAFAGTLEELEAARELNAGDIEAINNISSAQTITKLKGINEELYLLGVSAIQTTEDAGDFLNQFNAANAAIDQLITAPQTAIQTLQTVIDFPGRIVTSIKVRISVLENQFDTLAANLGLIPSKTDKIIAELIGGGIITTCAIGAVTSYDENGDVVDAGQLPDYENRNDVLAIILRLQALYNAYLALLDSIQSNNNGSINDYIPDAASISAIDEIINFTIENLYDIALSAKQEREIVLGEDSNLIILAHRFYGLQPDDSTIDQLAKNNNIGLNEILQIKKGRTLIYYI